MAANQDFGDDDAGTRFIDPELYDPKNYATDVFGYGFGKTFMGNLLAGFTWDQKSKSWKPNQTSSRAGVGAGSGLGVPKAKATTAAGKAGTSGKAGAAMKYGPAALKSAGSISGNMSKAKAEKQAREQENRNRAEQEQAVKDLFAKLEAKGIDPYRNITTRTSSQQGGGSSTTNTRSQMRRVIDPTTERMSGLADAQLEKLLAQPQQVSEGEKAAFARNANMTSEGARRAVQNIASSRGLSGAQAGALGVPIETNRTNEILKFLGEVPEVERQRAAALRAEAQSVTNARMGTNQNSTTNQDYSTWGTDSMRQEGPADLRTLASLLTPQGRISTNTGYNPWADGLNAAGEMWGAYNSMKGPKKPKPAWHSSDDGSGAYGNG